MLKEDVMRKIVFLLISITLLVTFLANVSPAQTGSISGKVTVDLTGEPIPYG